MGANIKLSIVGAGLVGSTVAYAALMRGVAETVALFDIDASKVRAETLDLQHGLQFVPPATIVGSSDPHVVSGSKVVVVTAGARQRPGESRLELADRSVAIVRSLMPKLVEQAPDAVYLMVSNPVDVITYAALRVTGLPRNQIFGTGTVLDTSRLRSLVAAHVGVSAQHVHAYIVGEHGDSEIPLWSQATIGGVPLEKWLGISGVGGLDDEVRSRIAKDVVGAAYTVIEGKGATNHAIGLATVSIVESLLRDERRIRPVSTLLHDVSGVDDVCLSLPCLIDSSGASEPLETPMDEREHSAFLASAAALRRVIERVGLQ